MPTKSILLTNEPAWFSNRMGTRHHIPADTQSWIYEPGSLTQRIRDYYGSTFAVKVLFHQRQKPFFSERRLLKQSNDQYSLIREVLLYANDKPLILARTIIPDKTLKGAQRSLSRLGNRPLGEVIFSYPKLKRLEMEICRVEEKKWSPAITQKYLLDQQVWGRRTVYAIHRRQMLVSEFFLPEILMSNC